MSFVNALEGSNGEKVFLVTGNEDGKPAWYYVKVSKKKMPFYENAIKRGSLDLREYGQIIDAGWGKNPPEKIVKKMESKYG